MMLVVTSPAFRGGDPIPSRFTCEGGDVRPELRVEGVPREAKTLALVVDDPDAPVGLWTHWTAWDLDPGATRFPEGFRPADAGGVEGRTSAKSVGWHGPCPPPGKVHRYFFRAYAVDARLGLPAGADRGELDRALRGHVLAQGELMGTFRR